MTYDCLLLISTFYNVCYYIAQYPVRRTTPGDKPVHSHNYQLDSSQPRCNYHDIGTAGFPPGFVNGILSIFVLGHVNMYWLSLGHILVFTLNSYYTNNILSVIFKCHNLHIFLFVLLSYIGKTQKNYNC